MKARAEANTPEGISDNLPVGGAGLSLLALLGGQMVLIYLLQAKLAELLVGKPEFIYQQVLPGLVWPLAFGWLFSAWLARRGGRSSSAGGWATAIPLGYNLAAATLLSVALLGPIFRQSVAQGTSVENAGNLAWSAGVALTLLVGLCQIMLAPFAQRLVGSLSIPVCLALGAALAGTTMAGYLPWLQLHPLMLLGGLIPLIAFLMVGLPRPFGMSLGWIVLGAGLFAQVASGTSFDLPDLASTLLPNWQVSWIEGGLQYLWVQPEFLSVAIPLLIAALVRDLVLLGECQSQPDAPSPRNTLLGLGCLNVLGACLGCGLPLGVLPGYLGYRRWGGGAFYTQGGGLLLVAFSLLGGFGSAFQWLPLPTLGLVFMAQLLVSAGTSLNRIGSQPGYLLAVCWLPFFAGTGEGFFLLIGLIWGGIVVTAQAGRLDRAAWVCLIGCLLACTGVLHRHLWDLEFDPTSGAYLVSAILLRIGFVMKADRGGVPAPPPPPDPALPGDSIESPGTSVFGIPGDNRSVEGAKSAIGS